VSYVFPLPEINGDAMYTLRKQILLSHRFMAPTEVSSITFTYNGTALPTSAFTFFVWFTDGNGLQMNLSVTRASEFESWLKGHGMKISEDKVATPPPPTNLPSGPVVPPLDLTIRAVFTDPCPICYGTGFYKGFGGPCSSGCAASR
jgi:hypothetical protein